MQRDIDLQASSITIRTRAKGLLAKLAHDLEIQAMEFDGEVELDGDSWTATLRFDVAKLEVVGALRGDKVDRAILSSSDREEIQRKIRQEHLTGGRVVVEAKGTTRTRADVTVQGPRGSHSLGVSLSTEDRPGGEVVAYGKLDLSLRRLGIAEIKGPLGAFKVDDRVEVAFWMMLAAPG
jgi:hypothetical protein